MQPKLNTELGSALGSSIVASLVNFGTALTLAAVAVGLRPRTRRTIAEVRSWPVPRWTLSAGLGGALVVVAGVVTVDTLGVAVFSVAFFAGQITSGLLIDRAGVGAGGKRPITAARIQAVVLAIAAVVVSQVGKPVGDLEPALVGFVVVAGVASGFQSAFNGRIAQTLGDPVAPTAVNVVVGTLALASIVSVLGVTGRISALDWPSEPWLYLGGVLGITVVLSLAVASAAMGVLRATLAMLAAQLTGAFVVDRVVAHQQPTLGAVGGAVLIVAAVARITSPSRPRRGARPTVA